SRFGFLHVAGTFRLGGFSGGGVGLLERLSDRVRLSLLGGFGGLWTLRRFLGQIAGLGGDCILPGSGLHGGRLLFGIGLHGSGLGDLIGQVGGLGGFRLAGGLLLLGLGFLNLLGGSFEPGDLLIDRLLGGLFRSRFLRAAFLGALLRGLLSAAGGSERGWI